MRIIVICFLFFISTYASATQQISYSSAFLLLNKSTILQDTNKIKLDSNKNKLDTTKSILFQPIPKRAAIKSAILPGWGQFYNKSYWKIPVVYTGIGITSYFIFINYIGYRKAYKGIALRQDANSNNDETPLFIRDFDYKKYDFTYSTLDDIYKVKQYFRHNLDLSVLSFLVVYSLQVVEASVNAHLYKFNMNDDFTYVPYFTGNTIGVKAFIK